MAHITKDADEMTNCADPDQTAPSGSGSTVCMKKQSDLGLQFAHTRMSDNLGSLWYQTNMCQMCDAVYSK